jgi:hypothetical protein
LLTQEPLHVLGVEVRGEHLYRHRPVQRRLHAPVDHTESAPPDLDRVLETRGGQLLGDAHHRIGPGYQRIEFGHRGRGLPSAVQRPPPSIGLLT